MRESFYSFFLPRSIADRNAAISGIVAGVIAGFLLTLVTGIASVVGYLRASGGTELTAGPGAIAVIMAIVTFGVWKHILSAAVLGMVVGIALIVWAIRHGQVVEALLLATPVVGGFWTAARGMITLKRFSQNL